MKKSLIALAALAASAAFAQSSVTLSGNLDYAWGHQSGGSAITSGNTVSTKDVTASTSVIRIAAVEDLGDGLKATAFYGIDPRVMANDNGNPTRDETYAGLSGGFGNLRLGSANSLGLEAFLAVSPLGTGIGSGFAQANANVSQIRYNRSVRYDSANLAGWTVSVLHAPGSDAASANGALTATARKATELSLTYANGPLAVKLVNIAQAAQGTNVKTSNSILGGQYNLGATTLYAAYMDGDLLSSTTSATEASGTRFAVKHNIGAVDLIASVQEVKFNSGANADKKLKTTGLRADYSLSKTAVVYVGYEDRVDGTDTTKNLKLTSFGLRKSF